MHIPLCSALALSLSLIPGILSAQSNPVDAAVASVDETLWTQTLQSLSGVRPLPLAAGAVTLESRHSSSRGNTLAGTYIQEQLEGMGLSTMVQTFDAPTGNERNIIGIKEGRGPGSAIYVLGAHYDSTCQDSDRCLGADDNGSGVATMLETARILSTFDTNATIHFVAFGSEEQGLYGSAAYVELAEEERWDIKGAAIIDMVGWYDRQFKLVVEGKISYLSWMNQALDAAADYTDVDTRRSLYSFGSDHIPFQKANIPAFLLIEQEWYKAPHYHTVDDTYDIIRPELGLEATRMMVGLMGAAAGLSRAVASAPAPAPERLDPQGVMVVPPERLGSGCRHEHDDGLADAAHGAH